MNETNKKLTRERVEQLKVRAEAWLPDGAVSLPASEAIAIYDALLVSFQHSESQAPEPHTEVTASAREQFERYFMEAEQWAGEAFRRDEDGDYIDGYTTIAWVSWEAAWPTSRALLPSPSEPVGVLLDVEKALEEAIGLAGIQRADHEHFPMIASKLSYKNPKNYPHLDAYLRAQQAPKGGS